MTQPLHLAGHACIAIDPGQTSGVALAVPQKGSPRPLVLFCGEVKGSTLFSLKRSLFAYLNVRLDLWSFEEHGKLIGVVERPQPQTRNRRDRSKVDTFVGIGTRITVGLFVLEHLSKPFPHTRFPLPKQLRQRRWTEHWRISNGKRGKGEHRLQEARAYLDFAENYPVSVDAAEACLMAGAVASGLEVK